MRISSSSVIVLLLPAIAVAHSPGGGRVRWCGIWGRVVSGSFCKNGLVKWEFFEVLGFE
jgi:hypothetical protein